MEYHNRYDYSTPKKKYKFEEILEIGIENAGSYHGGGHLESLDAKISEMTTILVCVCNLLPPTAKKELASHFGYEEISA